MKRAGLLVATFALAACNIPLVQFTGGGGDDGGTDAAADAETVAPGNYVWLRSLSQVATQRITAGPAGLVTPGYLYSTANFDGTLLTSAGDADLVIASFTEAAGTLLYAVRHGNVGSEFGLLATLASNGVPMVSGVVSGDMIYDLGLGPTTGGGGSGTADGYIGAYANGTAEWVQRIYGPGDDKILGSAVGPGSTVYGGGWFEDTTNFNGGMLTSAGGRDIFVARFNDFTGVVDLTKQFGGTGRDEVAGGGIAASDTSGFVMAGFFDDTIAFGGTAGSVTANKGGLDMWVAKFDATGTGVWAVSFGGPGDDRDNGIVMDSKGDIYMSGTFTTSITFGTIPLTAVGGAGTDDFLVKLDGSNGSVIWAISFGTTGSETSGVIAVDNVGHVAFTGPMSGAYEGGPTLGGIDALLAEFSSDNGSLLWQHIYSTPGDDGGGGVVYGETGDLFAVINLGGPFDFGMTVTGDPSPIGVLIRVAP